MSKYNSKKIQVDGITFDSKDEAKYYEALKIRKAKGEILNFELQPRFTLTNSFKKNGKTYRAITYTPDFTVYHNDGSVEYVDVKGMTTQQGELRIKLFNYFYRDLKLSIVDFYELKKLRRDNKKVINWTGNRKGNKRDR